MGERSDIAVHDDAFRAALERELPCVVPGFKARDRDVELAPDPGARSAATRRAAFAGVDRAGRAVLVLSVRGDDMDAVAAAIDARVWIAARGALLRRHVVARDERDPLLVIASAGFAAHVRVALAALRPEDLLVCELLLLRGANGTAAECRAVGAAPVPAGAEATARVQVAPRLAEAAAAGLARIDGDLAPVSAGEELVWSLGPGAPCALSDRGGVLTARVRGVSHTLAEDADVDRFLEHALRAWLEARTGSARAEPRAGGDLLPRGPLLSPEEIEALRPLA